jgi:hypothetical protein
MRVPNPAIGITSFIFISLSQPTDPQRPTKGQTYPDFDAQATMWCASYVLDYSIPPLSGKHHQARTDL